MAKHLQDCACHSYKSRLDDSQKSVCMKHFSAGMKSLLRGPCTPHGDTWATQVEVATGEASTWHGFWNPFQPRASITNLIGLPHASDLRATKRMAYVYTTSLNHPVHIGHFKRRRSLSATRLGCTECRARAAVSQQPPAQLPVPLM